MAVGRKKISKVWPVLRDSSGDIAVFALCKDDTLWFFLPPNGRWIQLPSIPECETKDG